MAKLFYGLAGLVFILSVAVLGEMYGFFDQPLLMNFLEKNFSPDGKITNPQGQYIKILTFTSKMMVFLIVFTFFFIKPWKRSIKFGVCSTLSVLLIVL